MLHPSLYVQESPGRGRGVFTKEPITAGTIIEVSPAIVMSAEDRVKLDQTLLHDYIFEWGADRKSCCMALGLIPIYNHSYESNCEYFMDFEAEEIMVKTVRAVIENEELTINYNGDWNDETKLWFVAS
jgi:SET domain-containing protein